MGQTSHHVKGPSCFAMTYIRTLGSWHTKVSIFWCQKGSLGGGGVPLNLVQYVLGYD
jgi:hypothetical protein